MALNHFSPFGTTRALERQIDEFLDKVSEGGLVFRRGLTAYLEQLQTLANEKLEQLTALEKRCDALRRKIETTLYTEMLIPESRSDVLNLLGNLDLLLDGFKVSLRMFLVEQPEVPSDCRVLILELGNLVIEAVEHTVLASRAFFRDAPSIRDSVHKIAYYEEESDEVEIRLLKQIFGAEIPLARKVHLRDAVQLIGVIADNAEDCGDRLTIYAIKRSL